MSKRTKIQSVHYKQRSLRYVWVALNQESFIKLLKTKLKDQLFPASRLHLFKYFLSPSNQDIQNPFTNVREQRWCSVLFLLRRHSTSWVVNCFTKSWKSICFTFMSNGQMFVHICPVKNVLLTNWVETCIDDHTSKRAVTVLDLENMSLSFQFIFLVVPMYVRVDSKCFGILVFLLPHLL